MTTTTSATTTDLTRTLLGAGVVAGPLFVGVAAVQAFTRTGFDLRRHPLSMLSLGEYGWIQVTNFIVAGVLSLLFAVGVARSPIHRAGQHLGTEAARALRGRSGDWRHLHRRSCARLSSRGACWLSRAAQRPWLDSCLRAAAGLPVHHRGLPDHRSPFRCGGVEACGCAHSGSCSGVLRVRHTGRTRLQCAPLYCSRPCLRLDRGVRGVPPAAREPLAIKGLWLECHNDVAADRGVDAVPEVPIRTRIQWLQARRGNQIEQPLPAQADGVEG